MTCNISKEQLIEYLYNDGMQSEEHARLQTHIAACASCSQILADLQTTSNMLQNWSNESPNLNMVFVQERQSFVPQIIKNHPWRWVSGIAATLAAMLILSYLNFEFAYQNGTFHASVGLQSTQPKFQNQISTPSEQEDVIYEVSAKDLKTTATQADLLIYQQATLALAEKLIRESEKRQRDDINSAFIHLIRDLEQQRQRDLQRVDQTLNEVYTTNLQNYQNLQEQWTRKYPTLLNTQPSRRSSQYPR